MVNLGKSDQKDWPDKYVVSFLAFFTDTQTGRIVCRHRWTAATADGRSSAQFEETLLVTEDGVEVLTAAPGWELPEELRAEAKGVVKGAGW